MKKVPHCKKCDQDGHYSVGCRNKPIKYNPHELVVIKNPKVKQKQSNLTTKTKKLSRSKLKKTLDKLVKDYVKQRDKYTCQHCHKTVSGVSCQASHVFSVGSCPTLQFEPLNIKVLCAYCHLRWWHSSPIEASQWFERTFPERLAILNVLKQSKVKTSTVELQMLIDEYRAKLKEKH